MNEPIKDFFAANFPQDLRKASKMVLFSDDSANFSLKSKSASKFSSFAKIWHSVLKVVRINDIWTSNIR